jgi:hypothetical protein
MMCRMDTTYIKQCASETCCNDADTRVALICRSCWNEAIRVASTGPLVSVAQLGDGVGDVPDVWSSDPDRTTRQFVASVPPGGQR